ncbi:MAG: methyltransferase domain-containing protein [Thermoleophilia bacterium]|nr:methyltransferase domain-containing protein [Thermoleophilia bacterium]
MNEKGFDPTRLSRLNNPARLRDIPPDYLWSKVGLNSADVLVEVGAGTALFSVALLQYAQPARVFACDVAETMIDWVKENVVPEHPEITPLLSEERVLPLEEASADLVFMINVYHELTDSLAVAKEAHRILKPGGKILVVDWKKEEMSEGPPLAIRWSVEEVIDELACAGFTDLTSHDDLAKHFVVIGKKREPM